ncbi:MAG TPA: hypothetical protein VNI01_13555, partial [Elusimicrobiota bacterium]|nr:hypothetical protein [Elusimicrobiota bacterium]
LGLYGSAAAVRSLTAAAAAEADAATKPIMAFALDQLKARHAVREPVHAPPPTKKTTTKKRTP